VPAPTEKVTQLLGPVEETREPLWWRLRQSAEAVEAETAKKERRIASIL
jgi:hypothetical protein